MEGFSRQSSHFDPASLDSDRAKCLLQREKQMRRYLARRGYSPWIIELAIDRVKQAAIPYIDGKKVCQLPDAESRRKWLFGALVKAAEQIASREVPCDLMEPGKLRDSVDEIRAAIRASRQGDERNALITSLHAALEELTERQREAIYLLYWKAMTYREAAQEMDCKPETVVDFERRGIHTLHTLLSVSGFGEKPLTRTHVH
jgi:RNA polymerase sigma factor (sigma-70 family)